MNRYILTCLGTLLFAVTGIAQTTVTGTVSDKGGPIPGVNIIVQGTTRGTISDLNGNFSIEVNNPNTDVLVFKFIGMDDIIEPLNGRISDIQILMTESVSKLDEVVVIGYGAQKRRDLTGAIATVSGKVLESIPTPNLSEALVGKLPGVQITTADGSADAEVTIRVRGGNSITGSNSPLILVDGFEVKSINDVSLSDVESSEVLKDAASTAIYGSRGANGVILITTKQPKEGRVNVNLNTYMQTKTLSNRLNVLDPYEYAIMQYENAWPKGSSARSAITNKYGQPWEYYIYQGDKGTDWQDEVFGTNPIAQFVDLNINGGTQKTKYKFSGQNQNQPSVMYGNGMKQTNINLDIITKIFDNLTLNYKARFMNRIVDGSGTEGVKVLDILRTAPTQGLDDYMVLPGDETYYDPDILEEVVRYDPRTESQKNYKKNNTRSFNTLLGITWNMTKNLVFHSDFGYEYRYSEIRRFWGLKTKTAIDNKKLPVAQVIFGQDPRLQLTNTLNYNFTLGEDHTFSLLAGQEVKNTEGYSYTNNYRYFPENINSSNVFDNLTLGTAYQSESNRITPVRKLSFFGRIDYSYLSRYLLKLSIRGDGSTKFARGKQWGVFPALAAAWRISDEEFLNSNLVISNLKLRFSYGTSGNDDIASDQFAQYYGVSRNRPAGWAETEGTDETPRYYYDFYDTKYLYNPDIKWETTTTGNLGLDFGFFKERLSGTLDYYYNKTRDLLVPTDIPGYTGYTKMMTNIGETSSKGIELALTGYVIEKKDFKLKIDFNIAYNQRRIDKLSSGETEWISSSGWAGSSLLNTDDYRAYVGDQKGLIYGFVNDGFYTMDDFQSFDAVTRKWILKPGVANSYNITGDPMPGYAKFKKLTPVDSSDPNTYYISDNDRQVIGNTNPKFSGGFGLNCTWKGFDLMLFFNFVNGFDVYNANKIALTSFWNNNRNNLGAEMSMDKRWRYTDDMGNYIGWIPDELAVRNKNATIWSPVSLTRPVCMSWAIENGSFLRLNTASVGYTVPEKLTQKIHINRLRFYASGYNLFVFTSYSGYDPEVKLETGLTPAVDYNSYPRSRTYTIGAQITF